VASVLLLTLGLVAVTLANGLGALWPADVAQLKLADGSSVLGELVKRDVDPGTGIRSLQLKTGNRELDPRRQDFRWYKEDDIARISYPKGVLVLERTGNGNFYGFLADVRGPLAERLEGDALARFGTALRAVQGAREEQIAPLEAEVYGLTQDLQTLKGRIRRLEYRLGQMRGAGAGEIPTHCAALEAELAQCRAQRDAIRVESERKTSEQNAHVAELRKNVAVFSIGPDQTYAVPLLDVVRHYTPNDMGVPAKIGHYLARIKELLLGWPRESNTEGGLFPAIFGTVMLVFLMSVSCFPLGVLAGVYLGEYAREGRLVRLVRIAVNNLAGIPSIVYGMFGLGFFIYGIGRLVDRWFFPEWYEVRQPVFGTGGVLWASLTLGLLTVPVVIVATEEALRTIPLAVREGSYALGATKFQTLLRVLLPIASPGIMTGFILAMARAAGEVAPLMLTGAIKLASDLAIDGRFPFFHLDRKFMHLGYHIYDIGFQSPNVEATKPMVYVTTLLLVLIVLGMTSVAIVLRNRMKRRYPSQAI
jgi:phosphate transport system permease protein